MKKIYSFILLLIINSCLVSAQFPAKITLNSNGEIQKSAITQSGKKYRITIEGTYSMWPEFSDCHGVDAAYVYDVPQKEIDDLKWPPKEIKIGPLKIPFVEIPHWVGDDKVWAFPPPQLGTALFEISFRRHKGFRVDGEPLANSGLNLISHRYQVEKIGTGKEFEFQIIDSNYSIAENKIIPRYEDNCGSLKINIECIDCIDSSNEDLNICDVNPICEDGIIKGIKLQASIFKQDTSNPNGRKNIISEIPLEQIGLVENGRFICSPDSIICGERLDAIALGLLIDRSGSMNGPISEYDDNLRLDASKNAINNFIDKMLVKDSAFIMSFSNNISLDHDWTNNKTNLKNTVSNLNASGTTAFYGAVLQALEKVSKSANPKRALIVLSDGANNVEPAWDDWILRIIEKKNIPVYIIALGLSNDEIDIEGREKMGIIATASRGKIYDVYSSTRLDSVYNELSKSISTDECCTIFFKIDPCEEKTNRFVRLIYTPRDTVILTKVINYLCDTCGSIISGVIDNDYNRTEEEIGIIPNPATNTLQIKTKAEINGYYKIVIYNLLGEKIEETIAEYISSGIYDKRIDLASYANGGYSILVLRDNQVIKSKIFIKK